MDPQTTEKLMADLRAVVRDAESLLAAAAAESGERLEGAAGEAREAAREIEAQVRAHPWAAVGIAAGVGLVLGLLLGRK
jgi:ElaB/YqjD/DUF883 family membrane-anchored ribosome-binding protein